MSIGEYFNSIKNFEMINQMFNLYSLDEIKLFILTQVAEKLANESCGQNTPINSRTIPHIRTCYGAGLGIISGLYSKSNLSEDTIQSLCFICNTIKRENFATYSKLDGIIANFCLVSK